MTEPITFALGFGCGVFSLAALLVVVIRFEFDPSPKTAAIDRQSEV